MDSVAYVARYIMKKQYKNNEDPEAVKRHYEVIDEDTGEVWDRKPEYSTMSRNIGKQWFLENTGDCYPKDFVTFQGEKFKPPKYYDRLFADLHPEGMEKIKKIRSIKRKVNNNNDLSRLRTRERVKILQTSRLIRPLGEHS